MRRCRRATDTTRTAITMEFSIWIILCTCLMQSCLSTCPENVDREAKCGNSGPKYHCQYDAGSDTTTTVCAPVVNCSAGTFASINTIEKKVTCTRCSLEMYQPRAKISTAFTQPNCDYRKTPCTEGELQCGADSPSQNFQCSCDGYQGWKPNPKEGCDCFIKDSSHCVCQQHRCKPGEKLINSTCVPVSAPTTSMTTPPSGTSGGTVAAIILAILLAIAILIIVALVILRYRNNSGGISRTTRENNSTAASPGPGVEAGSPGAEERSNDNTRGEHLYNRIKTIFIEAVDPKALLLRIDFGGFSDERLHEYIEKNAREDGARKLLLTVKRQFPNDWFERLTTALRHDSIGLSHTAEQMEGIRNRLISETAMTDNEGRVSTSENQPSENLPLLPTAPEAQGNESVNV